MASIKVKFSPSLIEYNHDTIYCQVIHERKSEDFGLMITDTANRYGNNNIRFRPSSAKAKEGTLYYQVIHMRLVKQLYTDLRLRHDEWDCARSTVIILKGCEPSRGKYLSSVTDELNEGMARLRAIVAALDSSGDSYTVDDVASAFSSYSATAGVVAFTRELIQELLAIGKRTTARRYRLTLSQLLRFTGGKEIEWSDFGPAKVAGLEGYLRRRGLCRNSTSFYMRNLRSIREFGIREALKS